MARRKPAMEIDCDSLKLLHLVLILVGRGPCSHRGGKGGLRSTEPCHRWPGHRDGASVLCDECFGVGGDGNHGALPFLLQAGFIVKHKRGAGNGTAPNGTNLCLKREFSTRSGRQSWSMTGLNWIPPGRSTDPGQIPNTSLTSFTWLRPTGTSVCS